MPQKHLMRTAILAVAILSAAFPAAQALALENWGPWRGVNISPLIAEKDLADLSKTGATLVRASFGPMPFVNKTPPYAFNEDAFKRLHAILDWCEKYNLKVVVDPHTAPGLKRAWTCEFEDAFWKDAKWHDYLANMWKRIATECKGRGDVIAGYDLLNEPATPPGPEGGPSDWNHLVSVLVRTIRATGDRHPVIVEPAAMRTAAGDYVSRQRALAYLKPPDDPAIVVSIHTYQPLNYTHQGVEGKPTGVVYPGKIDGAEWNRETLSKSMEPAREFQKVHPGIPIYIGEFSVSRFAGAGGLVYLGDLISIFEENKWSWSYHDYRASPEWNPEMTTPDFNKTRRDPNAPRMMLLKKAFTGGLAPGAPAAPSK